MADHYLQTIALLDEIEDVRAAIAEAYAIPRDYHPATKAPIRKPGVQERLNVLHARRTEIKDLAKIHATLAAAQMIAQAIRDADVPLTGTVLLSGDVL